ncbi:MAG: DNA primase small subunit domain-containing protein [Sulfolobales archaeon]
MSSTSRRDQSSQSLLKSLFAGYYSKAELRLPDDMEFREFALQPFDSQSYVRHLSFRSPEELRRYISQKPPLHLYYSSAVYLQPSAPSMDEKGWRGSDLLFDIDADQIPGCSVQKLYYCPGEGELRRKPPESQCPSGGGVEEIEIIEPGCIELAKRSLAMLIDILVEEIGIQRSSIEASFSGNRGFHIHCYVDENLRSLGREERRILVEYIRGSGFSPDEYYKGGERRKRTPIPPRAVDGGIPSRIARTYLRLVGVGDKEVVSYLTGISRSISRKVIDSLSDIWRKDLYEVYIDEKVTMDISRLVRIPYSINGKSGLIAYPIDITRIEDFELGPHLSPFNNMKARIKTKAKIPRINFYGIEFEANTQAYYEVEAPLAIFLALKGVADLVSIKR